MTWLLAPIADRLIVRKLVRAIDTKLGYPRTLADSEVTWHGGKPAAALPVRTETQCEVRINTNLGAIGVKLDAVIQALRGSDVNVDGEQIRIRIDDLGWQVVQNLPGNAANWTTVPPRDGGAGSATGVPVP
jgi:hypothetical protein